MNIRVIDAATSTQLQSSGNFVAHFGSFASGPPNFLLASRYKTGGGQNYTGTSNPELDRLIDQQAVMSRDPEGRKRLLLDIQRLMIQDATHITLGVYEQPTMALPEIRDFYPPVSLNNHNTFWVSLWIDK
jgi:ABC-type transport system substrate-binding protein